MYSVQWITQNSCDTISVKLSTLNFQFNCIDVAAEISKPSKPVFCNFSFCNFLLLPNLTRLICVVSSCTGDTLIVEEEKNKPKPQDHPTVTKTPRLEASPVVARRVVPADNSCLFTSVYYVVEGGVYDPACAPEMRGLIAQIVSSDPAAYSEAVLGKTNEEYCAWIRRDDTWGGAIEVSILSKFYQCEICVVDTQTVRVDRFGEDAGYHKRVLLIYDGIHYDPLQKETPGSDAPPQTIFATTDDVILALALELADEARRKRQFTDVNRFALRCMVCQTGLVGQKEAREHAKETGHTNFGEV